MQQDVLHRVCCTGCVAQGVLHRVCCAGCVARGVLRRVCWAGCVAQGVLGRVCCAGWGTDAISEPVVSNFWMQKCNLHLIVHASNISLREVGQVFPESYTHRCCYKVSMAYARAVI